MSQGLDDVIVRYLPLLIEGRPETLAGLFAGTPVI